MQEEEEEVQGAPPGRVGQGCHHARVIDEAGVGEGGELPDAADEEQRRVGALDLVRLDVRPGRGDGLATGHLLLPRLLHALVPVRLLGLGFRLRL